MGELYEASGELGSLDLHCLVTFDGTYYTYLYELTATAVVNPIHFFDVGNPLKLQYQDASNVGATHAFKNPVWKDYLTSVGWSNGEIKAGQAASFQYMTVYAPIERFTSSSGGGLSSEGVTLGMIPEPASVSLFGLCALSAVVFIRRRRA